MLFNGISKILGIAEGRDWVAVRREITDEKIRDAYGLYDALWPRETHLLERSDFGLNGVGDSRIAIVLIQTPGWAEASRRCRSHIRKICAIG